MGWLGATAFAGTVERLTSRKASCFAWGGYATIVRRVAVQRIEPAVERELCERAKAGDRAALGKILRAYGPVLYRAVLLPRLGGDAAAQDALAETYARVVERFDQYEWQDCGVYPWLRVVALRIALDILRSKKRETLFEPDDLAREIERADRGASASLDVEILEARDLDAARAKVEAALKTLNPRYERAIRLRVLEERSREDVARELGVSVSTFDVVLHRALTALKKAISKSSPDEELSKEVVS
ncbi:MAG: sigma-70 family RNA polymerase sigma factor [Polyangiaceae bacterium]|nr:sigma-70 family RNA polymerase sigma factor [Polyangiaceae bacterium]